MLELKINIIKERLWPAGIAALVLHSLMIAAMALGITYPQGISLQDFRAEVVFTSPLVGEVDSERREEEGEGYLPLETKHQEENTSAAAYPLPPTPLRLRAHLSHKGRKQPVKTSASPIPSSGGHLSGEADAIPVFTPSPVYPEEAKRKGIQGIVLVRLFLEKTGAVDKAITLPPRTNPLLEDAALTAVHTWRFKPGVRTLEVPIEFKLET
jgi:periplasmic protein TonB